MLSRISMVHLGFPEALWWKPSNIKGIGIDFIGYRLESQAGAMGCRMPRKMSVITGRIPAPYPAKAPWQGAQSFMTKAFASANLPLGKR